MTGFRPQGDNIFHAFTVHPLHQFPQTAHHHIRGKDLPLRITLSQLRGIRPASASQIQFTNVPGRDPGIIGSGQKYDFLIFGMSTHKVFNPSKSFTSSSPLRNPRLPRKAAFSPKVNSLSAGNEGPHTATGTGVTVC